MSAELPEGAQRARERLEEEIERIRAGIEEMAAPAGIDRETLRSELEGLRLESRRYVKRRVRKSEKRLRRSLTEAGSRADLLERRVERLEAERADAEARVHGEIERMLDGLLLELRAIADRLERLPSPAAR